MNWYKTLNIHQKISAKECFKLACGVEFDKLSFLFTFQQRIEILHNKLRLEGFDV